jgi:hypothetical protein
MCRSPATCYEEALGIGTLTPGGGADGDGAADVDAGGASDGKSGDGVRVASARSIAAATVS